MRTKHRFISLRKISCMTTLSILLLLCYTVIGLAEEPVYGYTMAIDHTPFIDLLDDTGKVLFHYYPDVRIELLSVIDDDWAHVRIFNIDGYMKTTQIDFDPELEKAPHTLPLSVIKGKTADGNVNFRELPTIDIPPLGYIYTENEVHVLGIGEKWHHINADGRMGFMKREYLEDTGKVSEYVIGSFQSPLR